MSGAEKQCLYLHVLFFHKQVELTDIIIIIIILFRTLSAYNI